MFTPPTRVDKYFNPKAFETAELKVLEHSGIPLDQFKIRNVYISPEDYVRTIEIGEKGDKQTIVLIHGYGGSSVKFWKIAKPLSDQYHLIMIDIIGMGGSSRPHFGLKDPKEVDVYLVDWLEKWREEMGIRNFVLAGHSFGGYVSGLYTMKYPENVKKLMLLSPLGISEIPPGFSIEKELQKLPAEMRPPMFILKFISFIWTYMSSPYELMR